MMTAIIRPEDDEQIICIIQVNVEGISETKTKEVDVILVQETHAYDRN